MTTAKTNHAVACVLGKYTPQVPLFSWSLLTCSEESLWRLLETSWLHVSRRVRMAAKSAVRPSMSTVCCATVCREMLHTMWVMSKGAGKERCTTTLRHGDVLLWFVDTRVPESLSVVCEEGFWCVPAITQRIAPTQDVCTHLDGCDSFLLPTQATNKAAVSIRPIYHDPSMKVNR